MTNEKELELVTQNVNHDEEAEKYLKALGEKDSYTRGDMETCFVMGCSTMEQLVPGRLGSFGMALGSLQHGFLVARQGWNGKGMFLLMRPADMLPDTMIVEKVKSLPYNFKQWVKNHPNERKERFFQQYLCMKAADGNIVNGWLPSTSDLFALDWVLVDPEK